MRTCLLDERWSELSRKADSSHKCGGCALQLLAERGQERKGWRENVAPVDVAHREPLTTAAALTRYPVPEAQGSPDESGLGRPVPCSDKDVWTTSGVLMAEEEAENDLADTGRRREHRRPGLLGGEGGGSIAKNRRQTLAEDVLLRDCLKRVCLDVQDLQGGVPHSVAE